MDPSQVSVLGRVDGERAVKKSEAPAGKKNRADDSPKPSSKKSKSSNKPRSDELRDLDKKWGERFTRLEAMLLPKTFAVPVEPVKKASLVVTSGQPIFDPGTSTSGLSSGVTVGGAGPSLAQTTGEAVFVSEAASKSATCPVEGPGTEVVRRGDEIQQNATQPVEAPGVGTATQPVEAPGVDPEVLLSGTDSVLSDSEEDLQSEPGSPAGDDFRYGSPDKDVFR